LVCSCASRKLADSSAATANGSPEDYHRIVRAANGDAAIDAEDKQINRKLKSICRGC
jgi:hypothetical protein